MKKRKIRLMTRLRPRKRPWRCWEGPMMGDQLWLETPNTLVFTYKGKTGHYYGGQWKALDNVVQLAA